MSLQYNKEDLDYTVPHKVVESFRWRFLGSFDVLKLLLHPNSYFHPYPFPYTSPLETELQGVGAEIFPYEMGQPFEALIHQKSSALKNADLAN